MRTSQLMTVVIGGCSGDYGDGGIYCPLILLLFHCCFPTLFTLSVHCYSSFVVRSTGLFYNLPILPIVIYTRWCSVHCYLVDVVLLPLLAVILLLLLVDLCQCQNTARMHLFPLLLEVTVTGTDCYLNTISTHIVVVLLILF